MSDYILGDSIKLFLFFASFENLASLLDSFNFNLHTLICTDIMAIKTENLVIAEETQTEWSKCEDGIQHRRRDCREKKNCGLESRACSQSVKAGGTMVVKCMLYNTFQVKSSFKVEIQNKGFNCPKDDCCPVFGCAVGLRFSSHTRQLEWCKRQCEEKGRRLFAVFSHIKKKINIYIYINPNPTQYLIHDSFPNIPYFIPYITQQTICNVGRCSNFPKILFLILFLSLLLIKLNF
uniref:Uncharacterized protein n=1 Tax=Heterorhabditis bacteriophora TaxID=37862 RepID=A0A1I7WA24_HETBA